MAGSGAVELAVAYISITPTFKGVREELDKGLGKPAREEGEDAGKKAGQGFAGGFEGAMGVLAGLGIADTLISSFSTELDKASLPSQFQAQFGQTPEMAAESGKLAADLYSQNWGESIADIGTSVGTVQRAIDQLGKGGNVKDLTTQAQALSDTFGEEVGATVNTASQLVKNKLAPDLDSAFDLLTAGFQGGANASQDFLDTLTEYSPQFAKFGLDGATSVGLLNQGLAAGARNSDLVADAIKEFSIRAVDGSELSAQGFEALGLSAEEMTDTFAKGGPGASAALDTVLGKLRDMKDPAERAQTAVALFGTQAEDLGDSLFALDPSAVAATGSMEDVDGAAANLATTVGGAPKASLETLGRAAQESLGGALQWVLPILQNVLGAIQPFLPVLGPIALAIGVLTAAQWAWNAALAANPIVLIIIGVVALVAVIIWLWNNVDGFKQFFVDAWNWILKAVKWVWEWIKTNWPYLLAIILGPFGLAIGWIIKNWDKVLAFFKAAWETIKSLFKRGVELAVGYFKAVWSIPGKIAAWAKEIFKKGTEKLGDFIGWIKRMPGKITKAASGMFNGIRDSLKNALNWVIEKWNNFSLTIGGGNVLGIDIPSITLNTPNIPYLAKGGIIPRTPGGRLAVIGEGREAEAVTPLSKLGALLDSAVERGGAVIDYNLLAATIAQAIGPIIVQLDRREIARANISGQRALTRQG